MSRQQMDKAVAWVGDDPERYRELWDIVMLNEDPISRRAVWAMDIHFSKWPYMFKIEADKMFEVLHNPCHTALQRHFAKMLSMLPIFPPEHTSTLFDLGIEWTNNAILPIAVRVHAMELAGRIALPYPELQSELKTVLSAHLDEGSAGFKSRANKWLRRIGH